MKKLSLILLIIVFFVLFNIKQDTEVRNYNSLNNAITEVYDWDFSSTENKDENVYMSFCQTICDDISTLEEVKKVDIKPVSYYDYCNEEMIYIDVYVCDETYVTEELKESICTYIESVNYYNEYLINYIIE